MMAPLLRNAGGNNAYCTPEGIVQVLRNITISELSVLTRSTYDYAFHLRQKLSVSFWDSL